MNIVRATMHTVCTVDSWNCWPSWVFVFKTFFLWNYSSWGNYYYSSPGQSFWTIQTIRSVGPIESICPAWRDNNDRGSRCCNYNSCTIWQSNSDNPAPKPECINTTIGSNPDKSKQTNPEQSNAKSEQLYATMGWKYWFSRINGPTLEHGNEFGLVVGQRGERSCFGGLWSCRFIDR